MAISFIRYVDITSGVGGQAAVMARELIARIFTTNDKIPPKTVIEFNTAKEVGDYFGVDTEEYRRASYYFGFVGKAITRARKISFYRWVNTTAPAKIIGGVLLTPLSEFKTITNGSFGIKLDAETLTVSGVDLNAVTSFADVATALQTAITTAGSADPLFSGATVTYDAVKKRFIFTAGLPSSGTANISISTVAGATGTDLLPLLNWGLGAIFADGADVETITELLTESDNISDNFGSFCFLTGTNPLALAQYQEAALWNKLQNIKYMLMVPVSPTTAQSYHQTLGEVGGTGATLSLLESQYPEMLPMAILAATDYTRVNATQNYMFYQSNLTPSVTKDLDANFYDGIRVNYYGQTQTAGKPLAFYQRGYLWGGATDPLDMNTYANEMWLKDAVKTELGNLLIVLRELSANDRGLAKVLNAIQSVINQGVNNGVISVGKPLTNTQIAYITDITNDERAYLQIQNLGYWLGAEIQIEGTDYIIKYILIYSKDDIVRKIIGSQILI